MYRLRTRDVGERKHAGGSPPAWPLSYDVLDKNFYLSMSIPVAGVAHQAATCRLGNDPATSVLDVNGKAHELDNLYVADTSFFPSSER